MDSMTLMTTLPGRWPREELANVNEPSSVVPSYPPPQSSRPTPTTMGQPLSTAASREEPLVSAEQNSEATSLSYLAFEPVVSSVANSHSIDWRRYDYPGELLRLQDCTSDEIKTILTTSIERLRARHVEEVERLAAAARRERPLTRGRRVSVKPSKDVSNETLDPTYPTNLARLSDASTVSASSFDSGYASRSPKIVPTSGPKAGSRSSFGLGSFFGLRNRDKTQSVPEFIERPRNIALQSTAMGATSVSAALIETSDVPAPTGTAMESETHWPAKCCLNTIPSSIVLGHLDPQAKKKYSQRKAEWSIPTSDRVYCARPACSTWIPAKNVNTQLHLAKCPKCSKLSCTICRGKFHNENDCPQDPNLQATINLAEMEGWKRCYSCQALVEHNKGCRHITCRCKAQFCYICGLRWRTCACTDTQLADIQQIATTRRREQSMRAARAVRDAEEERIVLQMVADFVQAEAEREAREAEVRRRIVEEERQRREEDRIAAVNLRFRQLTSELESLHDVQQVHMAERYEFELQKSKKEYQGSLKALAVRHSQETESLATDSRNLISDAETTFDTEYQTRLTEERRIEDAYVDELREYWKEHPEVEYKIREARDVLRKDQDKEYKFWDAHRRKQLQDASEREKRRLEALGVKQRSEIKVLDGRSNIDQVEWKWKKWAEGQWVEKVVRERVEMLQARERDEYAGVVD
ncbi:hypothetical protein LSUE1_G007603 [Lachnellula suecica]|uniref:IBR domain-containing protein n=1 Tax=Lachnellula suecica TaxID=602035 RepID=A0A8T9C2C6_9HELO|nr:hypothetical protein LSUE1_G007603 [Lachnellula suecica]